MKPKIKITICLGSSCFSRGNDRNLEVIQEYLKSHDLKERVDFRGHLCQQKCNRGPNVTINGKTYEKVNETTIVDILDKYFSNSEITSADIHREE